MRSGLGVPTEHLKRIAEREQIGQVLPVFKSHNSVFICNFDLFGNIACASNLGLLCGPIILEICVLLLRDAEKEGVHRSG